MTHAHEALRTVEVFISYAHEDEGLLDALITHLAILKRQRTIRDWHDRKIGVGIEWRDQIDDRLESADIVLLLVSPDFLASDFCYDIEMKRALERHAAGEVRVIPIILRRVDHWQSTPLGSLPALPTDGRPITSWANQDEALADVVRGIRLAAEQLREHPRPYAPQPPGSPVPRPTSAGQPPLAAGSLDGLIALGEPVAAPGSGRDAVAPPVAGRRLNTFKINFIHSLITSNELVDSGVIANPYSGHFDATADVDLELVQVYYHLPPKGYLFRQHSKIPVVAICDAGVQEVDRVKVIDQAYLRREVYPHHVGDLISAKMRAFVELMGAVLGGTFVLALALPEALVGREMKRKDLKIFYNTLMNLTLLPLVVSHSRNGFHRFHLVREPFANDSDSDKYIKAQATSLIKTCFNGAGSFSVREAQDDDDSYFYIYSCKVISYAAHRHYNEGDPSLLHLLSGAFSS